MTCQARGRGLGIQPETRRLRGQLYCKGKGCYMIPRGRTLWRQGRFPRRGNRVRAAWVRACEGTGKGTAEHLRGCLAAMTTTQIPRATSLSFCRRNTDAVYFVRRPRASRPSNIHVRHTSVMLLGSRTSLFLFMLQASVNCCGLRHHLSTYPTATNVT